MSQQPSGWYDDPANPDNIRYWDGVAWTNHTAPKKVPAPPVAPPPSTSSAPNAPGAPGTPGTQGGPLAPGWGQAPTPSHQQGSGYPGASGGYPTAPSGDWMHALATTIDGVPLASWGRRFGAWLIDGVILLVIVYTLTTALVPEYSQAFERAMAAVRAESETALQDAINSLLPHLWKIGLIQVFTVGLYCLAFWTTLAQTPGKMVVGISVRRVDRPGPLDLVTALKRRALSLISFIPYVSSIAQLVIIFDGLWPLWDDKRQSLHDKIAGTQVVMGKQPRSKA